MEPLRGDFLIHFGCNSALEGDLGAAGLSFRGYDSKRSEKVAQMLSKWSPEAPFGAAWRSFRPTLVGSGATWAPL